jgi:hypothetical protein
LPDLSPKKQAMRFDFPLLAEIGWIDRTDDGAVDVTDIDLRRTKEGRFLLLVW